MSEPLILIASSCRKKSVWKPVGQVMADTWSEKLQGAAPLAGVFGFHVVDQAEALDSMRKDAA